MIDMIDRIEIFRHDPDAVRRRHEGQNKPAVWVVPETDGMATLGATMTARRGHRPQRSPRVGRPGLPARHPIPRCCSAAAMPCSRSPPVPRSNATATVRIVPPRFPNPMLAAWVADQQNQAIAKGRVLVHVIADPDYRRRA
ncbi:hypothetical protein [Gordonia sp. (in: high G+C Gram-positive bacteria)]|uniref:hypothetical protein n=1 Tax=Gordonia sp. (in: high G+C Gram-positive bacteria) TaxID=84139 RepID=UPI0039188D5E